MYSYPCLHHFWRYLPSYLAIIFLIGIAGPIYSQSKIILQGLDKDSAVIQVNTGDKYYDSGGPGGSRLPDQPGNYQNCTDPFNESINCTSKFTFCSQGDTVSINFIEYLIVTGDRLRIFSGTKNSGTTLYNSQNQGVSINGMRLTTGTLLKSKSPDGCITVEWFCTTIGNSIGWDADIIINKKSVPGDSLCSPHCNNIVQVSFPPDTCFVKTNASQYFTKSDPSCTYDLKIFYPSNTDQLEGLTYNRSHVGKTFLFQVQDSLSSGSCVGYVSVKETSISKSFCGTDTIDCDQWVKSIANILTVNKCDGSTYKISKITFIPLDCATDFVGIVYREIDRLDADGSHSVCQDTVYINKMSFDSLECPMDINLDCRILSGIKPSELSPLFILSHFDLDNDNILDGTDALISPLVNHHLISDTSGLCKTAATYSDVIIQECGASFKIRREWLLSNTCSGRDSVCIQYIKVEDLAGPEIAPINPLNFEVREGECKTEIHLNEFSNIKDCSTVAQRVEFSYPDPASPGKTIVLNSLLPVTVTLPPGGYPLKYTFTDQCFNATRTEICLTVTEISRPIIKSVGKLVQWAAVNQCSNSVVADNLDSLVTGSCCNDYHLVVASSDTIQYYRSYWTNWLKTHCSANDSFEIHAEYYTALIDEWIAIYVFKDSLELSRCSDQHLVLRAYKACGLPERDSGFACSNHQWYCYHAFPAYRSWYNSQTTLSSTCPVSFNIKCLTDTTVAFDPSAFNFKFNVDLHFNDTLSCSNSSIRNSIETSSLQYAEADFTIKLLDTTSIVLPELPDLTYFASGEKYTSNPVNACCLDSVCLGESFAANAWPGIIVKKFDTSTVVGYYGGPVHPDASYDIHNYYSYQGCNEYDTIHFIRPIYCRNILMSGGDSINNSLLDTLFFKPVFNKIPGVGEFEIRTNCDTTWTTKQSDSISFDECNQGTIQRTWTLTSGCDRSASLIQQLHIKRKSVFEVIFPSDQVLDCNLSGFDTALLNQWIGRPIMAAADSKNIKVTYVDSLVPGAGCKTMMRVWKVVDNCIYNPLNKTGADIIVNDTLVADRYSRYCVYRSLKDGGDGIIWYKQLIQFNDTHAPSIHQRDTVVFATENCTSASLVLRPVVVDDCTPFPVLFKKVTIDMYGDGSIDRSYDFDSVVIVSPGLAIGKHLLKILVTDICGNKDSVTSIITVGDQGAPKANCMSGTNTLIIPFTGLLDVMAADFDAGSLSGCGGQSILHFSFSKDKNDSIKHFSCDSLGNKIYTIWVSNNSNQQSTCTISLQISPAFNACVAAQDFKVEGLIQTNVKAGIPGVVIKTNLLITSSSTNTSGFYSLKDLARGTNISIRPQKNEDPVNGLSTIDLLLIEKHIKGQTIITDPYLLIAADVNRSNTVTVADLVELRKLILGTISSFTNAKSWVFVPKSFVFADPANPWIFPEIIEYNPLNSTITDADFVGIKMGDINNSAILSFQHPESRSVSKSPFYFKYSSSDNRLSLFSYNDLESIEGLQLGINLIPGFHLKSATDDQLHLDNTMFNEQTSGLVKLCWTASSGKYLNKNNPLISFTSRGLAPGIPAYNSYGFQSFIIHQGGVLENLAGLVPLEVINLNLVVYPNPSKDQVTISFYVDNPQDFKSCLTYPDGKILNLNIPNLKQGQNRILLNKSDLGGNGMYYFVVTNGKITQKQLFIMF
ncbi:MAG: hypothetical protein ABI761_01550 [Saprospiraceae bacterium]